MRETETRVADDETPEKTTEPAKKLGWRERLAEYGRVGLFTYFGVFFLTWLGFFVLISRGFQVEGVVGETSTWFAAYLATKVTQPIRIAVVLVLTPLVAAGVNRFRRNQLGAVPTPPSLTTPEADTRPDP